ncbi:MAG: NYN domain-containing protein [Actinobacteria bacterium]|nr:NYN domain-containing protein [Actinomycetota bacterium]
MTDATTTYVLVDGENIDWALGSILDRKPEPGERPRWKQLVEHTRNRWDQPVRALFFLNGTNHVPMTFVQALMAMDYRPVLLSGAADEKVVDIGIQRTLRAIAERGGDVLLASHDADFAADMAALAQQGRRIGIVGFPELVSHELRDIPSIEIVDLESDAGSFDIRLPRVRVVPLSEFDPADYL